MPSFHALSIGRDGLVIEAPASGAAIGRGLVLTAGAGNNWSAGFADFPTISAAAIAAALTYTPADDAAVVKLAGDQTVGGNKTLTGTLAGVAATFSGNVQQGFGSSTVSFRQRMSATGVANLEPGDGAGTFQNGLAVGYDAGGVQLGFFGNTPVAKQSGDVAAGLVALGLFSSATSGGGSSGVSVGLVLSIKPPPAGM